MIPSQLMSHFMSYIIDIKFIAFWKTRTRRGISTTFIFICNIFCIIIANTSNTTCITSSTRSAKQVSYIISSIIGC